MIHNIKEWFKAAKPNPSTADACVQIGCHYEKVSEMGAALCDDDVACEVADTALLYKMKNICYIGAIEEPNADARVEL